jgi:drug/metabolite transporter (DMT)-like permease
MAGYDGYHTDGIGTHLIYYTVGHIRPTVVSAVPLGEPIIASLMAYLFFKKQFQFSPLLGEGLHCWVCISW